MIEGNVLAAVALIAWPIIGLTLFRVLPMGRALIANVLISYLFLPPTPAGFDPPLFPALNKDSIPNIVIILACLFLAKERIEWLPRNVFARGLVAIFVLSPVLTVLTNQDPVFHGIVGLPGLRFVEALAICIQQALFLAPMLLARHFLVHEEDHRDLMVAFVIAGVAYSIPTLIEVRLSPQLNNWVYGFYQHSFAQTIRFGGFRPLVFLYHGIWLAFFMMVTVIAAVALARAERGAARIKYLVAAVYLGVVLVLCKSAGAVLFAALLVPLVLVLSQRLQLSIAAFLAVLAMSYPLLKQGGIVPEDRILTSIAQVNQERAASLEFRLRNEDILLERARERPVFGWGTWGRNHLLNPLTGDLLTVTDGRWIIVIGVFGWLGFLAEFGLLAFPILYVWWKGMHPNREGLSPMVGPIALLLAINILDLIPNATITPVTFLFGGGLLGYIERYRPGQHASMQPAFATHM